MGFTARGVSFSNVLQGGHAAASWRVPVANAYLSPPTFLRRGERAVIYDGEYELWEGEIREVRPSIDVLAGTHEFVVTGGGLLSTAARRMDFTKTWVHRGAADWRIHPDANRSGEYTVGSEDGVLQLLIRKGDKTDFVIPLYVVYYIDNLLSDDYVSHIDCVAEWDTTSEGTYAFSWNIWCNATIRTEANTSSAGTTFDNTPAGSQKAVTVQLSGYDTAALNVLTTDRYVRFPTMDIYGSSQTAKLRIDQVMVDAATRTGLAISTSSETIGQVLDDCHFEKTSAADVLTTVAGMHAEPLDWGFWDDQTFRVRTIPRRPEKLHEVVVVGGGHPGLTRWDVTPQDDSIPDYVAVYFRNLDDPSYPEGMVRCLWVPHTPPDTAAVTVERLDFSSLILSDAAATTAALQLLGGESTEYTLPSGVVFSAHPEYADSSESAGNNTDPTSSYAQTSPGWAAGTLNGFAYTAGSGWAGTNSPLDPTRLEFDGVDDDVSWGDESTLDFGTSAFSFTVPIWLDEIDKAQVIAQKWDSVNNNGWELIVTASNNLMAYVEMGTNLKYDIAVNATELEVDTLYYAALTWDGTTGRNLTLYVNAISDDRYTAGVGTSPESISTTTAFKLGEAT